MSEERRHCRLCGDSLAGRSWRQVRLSPLVNVTDSYVHDTCLALREAEQREAQRKAPRP